MRRLRSRRGRRLLLPLLMIVALAGCGGEEASPPTGAAPPPLPAVDLSAAEPAVREQLAAARAELDAVLAGDGGAAERAAAWGRIARLYHAYELDEPALVAYAHARALAPREPRWAYLAGVVHQQRGAFREARRAFTDTVRLGGEYEAAARFRQAQTALADGEPGVARELWQGLLEDPGFTAAASAHLGRLALAEGHRRSAVEHLERALALQPEASALYHPLAQALRGLGRPGEADTALTRAGEVPVDWPDPLSGEVAALRTGVTGRLWAASRAAAGGDLAAAAALYEDVLKAEPGNLEAMQGLAGVLVASGEHRRAIDLLSRVVEQDPAAGGARLRLARLLELVDEREAALDHYRQAVAGAPELVENHLYLAAALQRVGRPADAVAVYERLLSERPGERLAVLGRAQALAAAGEPDPARRAIDEHLRARPDDLEALLLAGQLAAQTSDPAAAEEAFRGVLESAEASAALRAAAALQLGSMWSQTERHDEALPALRRAVELAPDMVPARVALARLLMRRGDPAAAAGHLAAAVAAAPGSVDLRLLEAQALAASRRPVEALRRVEAALELFPGEPRLLAARRSLEAATAG